MRERFNVEQWVRSMRIAIATRAEGWVCELLAENDPDGTYNYHEVVSLFGPITRAEWVEQVVECAETMLEQVESEL
jgi:hypothetical protein